MSSGIVLILFIVLLMLTVPVGLILMIVSLSPNLIDPRFAVDAEYLVRNVVTAFDNPTLIAIPLFIISGVVMARGGISQKLYDVFAYFVGGLPGGMPCAVVITCLFYGAISGSGPATTAAVGAMTIPLLLKLGYKLDFCAALVAVAGGLGVIIPPSIPFVLYSNSSSASVGDMFVAGIIPGLLIGTLLIAYTVYYCVKKGEDKEKISLMLHELRGRGFFNIFKEGIWSLLCPVIILGGIYRGIFTPTEAACVSVVYALFVSLFIYKTMKFSEIVPAFIESVPTIASSLIICGGAAVFAKCITFLRVPQLLGEVLGPIAENKIALMLLMNLIFLVAGCVMDTAAATLIFTPILLPLVQPIGMNVVHFGIMMVVNLSIGFVTPPVGMNLYVASSLTRVPPMAIAKKAVPLLIMFFIALMMITFIPEISLCLL